MAENHTDPGILRSDIYHIGFYEKSPFSGSWRGMHYRIEGVGGEEESRQLRVTTWPGPYNYDTTDDSRKVSALFPFSDEGLDAVAEYLNDYYRAHEGTDWG